MSFPVPSGEQGIEAKVKMPGAMKFDAPSKRFDTSLVKQKHGSFLEIIGKVDHWWSLGKWIIYIYIQTFLKSGSLGKNITPGCWSNLNSKAYKSNRTSHNTWKNGLRVCLVSGKVSSCWPSYALFSPVLYQLRMDLQMPKAFACICSIAKAVIIIIDNHPFNMTQQSYRQRTAFPLIWICSKS